MDNKYAKHLRGWVYSSEDIKGKAALQKLKDMFMHPRTSVLPKDFPKDTQILSKVGLLRAEKKTVVVRPGDGSPPPHGPHGHGHGQFVHSPDELAPLPHLQHAQHAHFQHPHLHLQQHIHQYQHMHPQLPVPLGHPPAGPAPVSYTHVDVSAGSIDGSISPPTSVGADMDHAHMDHAHHASQMNSQMQGMSADDLDSPEPAE